MGFDNMTAASAPEEGRKCWLKVTLDGKSRMVEWNSAWNTFKDMDTKVRRMFALHEKARLLYTYKDNTQTDIIMVCFLFSIHHSFIISQTTFSLPMKSWVPLCILWLVKS